MEIRKAAYEWLLSGEEQVARTPPPAALAFVNSLAFLVVQLTAVIEDDPADLAAIVANLREASLAYLTSSGPVRGGT